MEMADKLYMINFEVEEFEKLKERMDELDNRLDPNLKDGEDGGERPEEEEGYKPEDVPPPNGDPNAGSGTPETNPNNNSMGEGQKL